MTARVIDIDALRANCTPHGQLVLSRKDVDVLIAEAEHGHRMMLAMLDALEDTRDLLSRQPGIGNPDDERTKLLVRIRKLLAGEGPD
jgi:hypothetical protein